MESNSSAIVIDNGTGYTKMGYAGNMEPSLVIPSVLADYASGTKQAFDEYNYYIGDEAFTKPSTHDISYLLRGGMVQDWEKMEKFWHKSMFSYLRVEPEEHEVVLTEPPLNTPENREQMAEIMFETFNIKGLFIGVQAVLALYAGVYAGDRSSEVKQDQLTGTVIDSGDGVTHVIPISFGYPIASNIKHIPLAGRNITEFVMASLRERKEPIPSGEFKEISRILKEKYCYVCSDIVKEHGKFDQKIKDDITGMFSQSKKFKSVNLISPHSGKQITCDMGYEQFMAPEMFFHPEFASDDWKTPIDEIVDHAIMKCPIDTRVSLYANIVLSGGSTLFKNFEKRLEREVQNRVSERYDALGIKDNAPKVKVSQNIVQKSAVWFGGSIIASNANFVNIVKTKKEYEEYGPSIARHNPMFKM